MTRLPLLAALAVTAAGTPTTCETDKECGEGLFCRAAVAAFGGVCDSSLPMTCAKLSGRGEPCGGGGGEAYDCFRNRCKSPLSCRKTVGAKEDLPGTCAKQCLVDLEGKESLTVYEGWTGPAKDPTKWCQKRYCDGTGDTERGELKDVGGDDTCPQDLAGGLRCCVGEGEKGKGQECCGSTGSWVTPVVDGTVTCAGVEAKAGGKLAAPFSRTCTGVCARKGAEAVDDRWKGPSTEAGEWCNTCVCARGALACTKHRCPALKCCSTADREKKVEQACCGVSGKWVTKDGKGNVVCGGVTLPYKADLATAPFHAACTDPRTCTLFSNVAVTVAHEESVANPRRGQGCNECTCTDGTLACATAVCGGLKCCDGAKKPDVGEQLCCGLTGEWVAAGGDGTCGAYATQVTPEGKKVGVAATGYPFFEACAPQCAANTGVGGPDKAVPVGWTGRKGAFTDGGKAGTPLWCDTCACGFAKGAKADAPPVVTCTTHGACPAVLCCPGKAPADSGYACCGATRRWVKATPVKGGKDQVACGGVTVAADSTAAPLDKACTATCTLPGGAVLGEGLSGPDAGEHWCKRCRCEKGKPECTKNACEKRCCRAALPKEPASAAHRCCGASGVWVALDATTKTYWCGGALVADGAAQLHADPEGAGTDAEKGICETVVEADTRCKLHNAAETVVEQGWSGPGLGVSWCHTCRCGAADVRGKVSCPTGPCPAAEKLLCCAKTKDTGEVCCGLTGEWVASDKMCGDVDLGVAGTDAGTAPVAAACVKCTLPEGGAEVAVGWFDFAPGANWCNKCHCAADGELKCTQRVCRAPTCCAGDKGADTDVCCGATGDWVAVGTGADAGKYACGGVAVAKADTDKLPFFEACTTGCVLPDATPVAVDWAGKKGDGCNYCKCVSDGVLRCSTRVCPPTPSPPPAPTPPPTPPPALTCRSYPCDRDFPGITLGPLHDKPGKDGIGCRATGCTAHRCCDSVDATILSPGGGSVAYPADRAPRSLTLPDYTLWILHCEGRVPQVNLDSFSGTNRHVGLMSYTARAVDSSPWGRNDKPAAGAEYIGGAFIVLHIKDADVAARFSLRYKCIDP